ncbi:hypothetical protein LPJ76_002097 [Coemansia sp. RSA 638]|nr:hypothetical protein LPJ76_002097 [Coemansia sp. RSA 638]
MSSSDTEATAPKPVKRNTGAQIKQANREKQRIFREGSIETQQHAHTYLTTWNCDKSSWKFNKARQLWIIRHLYDSSRMPLDMFEIAVRYLAESMGKLRDTLLEDAQLVANPTMAVTDEQKAQRTRVLGLMPSHVTKGDAKMQKRAKASAKAEDAKDEKDEEAKKEESVQPVEVEVGTRERAERIIDALTKPKVVEPVVGDSDEKPAKKRKSDEKESKSDKKAKKEKSEKKDKKEKKEKKDKKDKKDKSEKKDKKDKSKSKE